MRCDMNRVPARFAITLTFLGSFTGIVNVQTRLPPVPGALGIYVRHSPDGGRTWDSEPVAVIAWTGEEPEVKLEDMPRIWADTQPASPHHGNLYIAWIEWQIDKSIVLFSRSTDGGKTW